MRRQARRQARGGRHLIERIDGPRCVDCGRLEMSRTTESLTALLISVNSRYKAHAGIQPDRPARRAVGVATADVVVLTGGTGGAKLARGLSDVRRPGARWPRSSTPAMTSRSTARTSRPTPTSCPSGWPTPIDERGWGLRDDTLRGDGRAARAGSGGVVQPRRPRPGLVHASAPHAGRGVSPPRRRSRG